MYEKLETMVGNWFGQVGDIQEELEELGADVLEANREYVVVAFEDNGEDVQVAIVLGGTERTITVESVEEIYRG